MPILTITLKGEELKSKTVNLHDPLNLRYFKLLHVNHSPCVGAVDELTTVDCVRSFLSSSSESSSDIRSVGAETRFLRIYTMRRKYVRQATSKKS